MGTLFIDADDFFLPDAFDTLDRYLECEKEICLFYPKRFYSDNLEPAKILYPRNHFMEYFFAILARKPRENLGYINSNEQILTNFFRKYHFFVHHT